MPMKENFYYLHPDSRGLAMPCRAIWGSTRFGQEADGMRGKHGPETCLCFLQERQGRAEKQLRIG